MKEFAFAGTRLNALPSGGLWWPDESVLCVSDLHMGKALRGARQGGAALPPYELQETLTRLEADISATGARHVICLGDSFDDLSSEDDMDAEDKIWLSRLMAGRRWTWVEGNHDPGPVALGGAHMREVRLGPLVFRHIATARASGEVSGHYHPKAAISARGRRITRRCFLVDGKRLVMPSYGTYTGGLFSHNPTLSVLMEENARAILLGDEPVVIPMPR